MTDFMLVVLRHITHIDFETARYGSLGNDVQIPPAASRIHRAGILGLVIFEDPDQIDLDRLVPHRAGQDGRPAFHTVVHRGPEGHGLTSAPFELRHPRATVLAVLVAALLGLAGAPRLRSDFGLEQLVPAGDPEIRRYHELGQRFGRDDNVVLVLMTHPRLFTLEGARDVVGLTRDLEASPLVEKVAQTLEALPE